MSEPSRIDSKTHELVSTRRLERTGLPRPLATTAAINVTPLSAPDAPQSKQWDSSARLSTASTELLRNRRAGGKGYRAVGPRRTWVTASSRWHSERPFGQRIQPCPNATTT